MVATSVFAGAGSIKQGECPCEVRRVDGVITESAEPLYEFPELFSLVEKLIEKKPLDETDEANLRELVEATGWSVEDVTDDLRNGWGDPLGRVDRYRELFEKYYSETLELVDRDSRQAAEKLGAL